MSETTTRPARPRRGARAATVLSSEWLSTSMLRLTLGGEGLRGFEPSPFADSYVKVLFVHDDVPRPLPRTDDGRVDVDGVRDALPEKAPRMRSYTVRGYDAASADGGADGGVLTLDFVVHGDVGIAGPWAAGARPGDEVLLLGPGGGYSPDPAADHHLLVGDLSALPAIAVALEQLQDTDDARGQVVIEVPGPADELALSTPAGVSVTWVHQEEAAPGERLVAAVRALPWPEGDVHAFVHGEAGAVKELRRYLRLERGLALERLSISGYWRLGVDDEGWRASKRDWNAEVEAAEAGAASA